MLLLQMGKGERGRDTRTKGYQNLAENLALHGALILMSYELPGPFSVLCLPKALVSNCQREARKSQGHST